MLAYGREELGLERVNAFVDRENQASLRLCEKLGFREEERVITDGRECVRLLYSFL